MFNADVTGLLESVLVVLVLEPIGLVADIYILQ
jgi:hypothetical protein